MTVLQALRRVAPLSECRADDEAVDVLATSLGVPKSHYTWDISAQAYRGGDQ